MRAQDGCLSSPPFPLPAPLVPPCRSPMLKPQVILPLCCPASLTSDSQVRAVQDPISGGTRVMSLLQHHASGERQCRMRGTASGTFSLWPHQLPQRPPSPCHTPQMSNHVRLHQIDRTKSTGLSQQHAAHTCAAKGGPAGRGQRWRTAAWKLCCCASRGGVGG